MSDEDLRGLERAWRASGTVEDEATWLAARRRAGDVQDDALRAAARLGHAASRTMLGLAAVGVVDEPVDVVCAHRQDPLDRARDLALLGLAWAEGTVIGAGATWKWSLQREEDIREVHRALESARRALLAPTETPPASSSLRIPSELGRSFDLIEGAIRLANLVASSRAGQPFPDPALTWRARPIARWLLEDPADWLHAGAEARRVLGEARAQELARRTLVPRFLGVERR